MRALVLSPLLTLIGGGLGAGAGYPLGGNQGALIGGGAGAASAR
jgi:hypothetical protein